MTNINTLLSDMTVIRDIAEIDRAYPDLDLLVRVLDEAIDVIASADTPPKDGDALAAPLGSGAVPKADAQPSSPHTDNHP